MALMTMQEHLDVADTQEWLNRLQLFLAAQGWTIESHLPNSAWQQGTGFIAGDEHYLEVTSNGYGNQNLHIRMLITGSNTNRRSFKANIGYGNTDIDTTSFTHPYARFKNPSTLNFENRPFSNSISNDGIATFVSSLTMPRVWYFGFEQKYACIVTQLDAQRVHYIHFGTMQMHDLNSDYGAFCYGVDDLDWQTNIIDSPFDVTGFFSFDQYVTHASTQAQQNNRNSVIMSTFTGAHQEFLLNNAFDSMPHTYCIKNSFSSLRPMMRGKHYVKDPGDGIWFYSARHFWYRLSVEGFRIGERFKISTEEYISFPNFQVDASRIGVAFRIL